MRSAVATRGKVSVDRVVSLRYVLAPGKPGLGHKARQPRDRECDLTRTSTAVMPLDVLGRTRATLTEPASPSLGRKVWVIL